MKKRSIVYEIIKPIVAVAHRLFYKEIIVEGRENIPKSGALIFAPNHQNALMDALAVVFTNRRLTIFLARADVFNNSFIAKLLRGLKMLPVYRQRDGRESLEKNEEIFNKATDILEYKSCLCLFPEASHTNKRRLQPLKKGVQRIAFQTESKNNFEVGLKIVTVGIYYSDYFSSRSVLRIQYGKPLTVSNYRELYLQNEQKAMLALRDDITTLIKPMIIDIQNNDYYHTYEYLREIYYRDVLNKLNLKINQRNKFIADKKIIESLDNYVKEHNVEMKELSANVIIYERRLKKYNLSDKVFTSKNNIPFLLIKSLILILLSPVFIYVYLINLLPYHIPKLLIKKIKDRQFYSTIKFGAGLILFPLYYFIITGLLFILNDNTFFNIMVSIFFWISLYVFFKFREIFKNVVLEWNLIKIKFYKPNIFNELIKMRNYIRDKMNQIVN